MQAEPDGPAQGHGPTEPTTPFRKSWWRHPLLWLLLGLVIIFWVLPQFNISLFGTSQPSAAISYSTFVAQVAANNVASVMITEYSITGVAKVAVTSQDGKTHSTQFTTTAPQFGNDDLIPLLQQHHVSIAVESSNSGAVSFWVNLILFAILPIILLVGLFWWMSRRASAAQGGLFSFGQSRPRLYLADGKTQTRFDDVAGVDEAKAELVEIVDYLKAPERYQRLGGRVPKGVLLVGPPAPGRHCWRSRCTVPLYDRLGICGDAGGRGHQPRARPFREGQEEHALHYFH